jgi:hypothetical protein
VIEVCTPPIIQELYTTMNRMEEDHADHVARVVDLARFGTAVRAAIDRGQVDPEIWTTLHDARLTRALGLIDHPLSSAERSEASRAAKRLTFLTSRHLKDHAA